VKKIILTKWSALGIAAPLVIASCVGLARLWLFDDCSIKLDDRSIVIFERFGNVENGSAFDRATVDLGTAKKIALPDNAVVRKTAEAGQVRLFMKKTLAFGGHPPEAMSIRGARKNMGCAVKVEGETLVVATYGEWDSHIEGGTDLRLVAVVPDGIEVVQRAGLSGQDSVGQEWHGKYLTKPKDAQGGYWYGPASPAEGWSAVPDVPDSGRTPN
jgi:hypothetical protein